MSVLLKGRILYESGLSLLRPAAATNLFWTSFCQDPNLPRYSPEIMNALTISALTKLPLN
jgi:hypothetical protein